MSAFDINAIINSAITEVVNARLVEIQQQHLNAIGELAGQITALQTKLDALAEPAVPAPAEPAVPTEQTPVVPTEQTLAALDNAEWFWMKVANFMGRELEGVEDRLQERMKEHLQEWARDAAEEAVNDHCESYDHDDYDNTSRTVDDLPDLDDLVTPDSLREAIEEVLNNASISIRV